MLLAFDNSQIDAGIKRMRTDAEAKIRIGDDAWPPNAFEFACYCKPHNPHYFHSPALPPPAKTSTREYALEQIAEIKEKLRVSAKPREADETFSRTDNGYGI